MLKKIEESRITLKIYLLNSEQLIFQRNYFRFKQFNYFTRKKFEQKIK